MYTVTSRVCTPTAPRTSVTVIVTAYTPGTKNRHSRRPATVPDALNPVAGATLHAYVNTPPSGSKLPVPSNTTGSFAATLNVDGSATSTATGGAFTLSDTLIAAVPITTPSLSSAFTASTFAPLLSATPVTVHNPRFDVVGTHANTASGCPTTTTRWVLLDAFPFNVNSGFVTVWLFAVVTANTRV